MQATNIKRFAAVGLAALSLALGHGLAAAPPSAAAQELRPNPLAQQPFGAADVRVPGTVRHPHWSVRIVYPFWPIRYFLAQRYRVECAQSGPPYWWWSDVMDSGNTTVVTCNHKHY